MDWLTSAFLGFVGDTNNPLVLAGLALAAALEYVFPPFPGDTITLLGAVLITGYGWNAPLLFGAVTIGSVAGAWVAFAFGQLWAERRAARAGENVAPLLLDELVAKFRRHGAVYLVLNRFMPGLRALFFIAAGLARMKTSAVLTYSAISACLWNLALLAAGSLIGANLDTLGRLLSRYTIAVWIGVGLISIIAAIRIVRRRARRPRAPE